MFAEAPAAGDYAVDGQSAPTHVEAAGIAGCQGDAAVCTKGEGATREVVRKISSGEGEAGCIEGARRCSQAGFLVDAEEASSGGSVTGVGVRPSEVDGIRRCDVSGTADDPVDVDESATQGESGPAIDRNVVAEGSAYRNRSVRGHADRSGAEAGRIGKRDAAATENGSAGIGVRPRQSEASRTRLGETIGSGEDGADGGICRRGDGGCATTGKS